MAKTFIESWRDLVDATGYTALIHWVMDKAARVLQAMTGLIRWLRS